MDVVQLSSTHEIFCQHYVTNGGNATQAAKDAGYSPVSAHNQGSVLLERIDVQLRIEQLKMATVDKLQITREAVIRAYGAIALTDRRGLKVKRVEDLTDEEAMCIDGFKFDNEGGLSEIKTVSRAPALKALGEHFNIFEDHQKSGTGEVHIHIDGKDDQL